MKRTSRWLLVVAALVVAALPAAAYLSGRDSLVFSAIAVGLAALCSFLAYRTALMFRRKIDMIGDTPPKTRHESDADRSSDVQNG